MSRANWLIINEMNYLLRVGDGTFTTGPTFNTSKIANTEEFTFGGE
jgi:hypothetical protein